MYLIVGANGFLGSYIIKNILDITSEDIIALDLNDVKSENSRVKWISCDISDFFRVDQVLDMIGSKEKLKCVYLAAYHHPDMVEKNPRIAWNINITALSYFLNRLDGVECFFYPSTDTVYGEGTKSKHFKEDAPLAPVNAYGKHKALAEQLVTGYGYRAVRFPFLIGPSLLPNRKHFYDVIAETISMRKTIEMFRDSLRSTLDFNMAARLLVMLTQMDMEVIPPILNLSGDDDLSKYDVGLMIANKLGADTSLIVPIDLSQTEGIFEVKRASIALLDNTRVKQILGLEKITISI